MCLFSVQNYVKNEKKEDNSKKWGGVRMTSSWILDFSSPQFLHAKETKNSVTKALLSRKRNVRSEQRVDNPHIHRHNICNTYAATFETWETASNTTAYIRETKRNA